jgi:hypothetical protein
MKLEELATAKAHRKEIFYELFFAAESYRDLSIEIILEHENFGIIKFICEKDPLTENDIKRGLKQGDKRYSITGFIYDEDTSGLDPEEKTCILCKSVAQQFLDLEQAYRENPKTKPFLFSIRTIDGMKEYTESNKISYIKPTTIPDFLQCVEYYIFEGKEEGKS